MSRLFHPLDAANVARAQVQAIPRGSPGHSCPFFFEPKVLFETMGLSALDALSMNVDGL